MISIQRVYKRFSLYGKPKDRLLEAIPGLSGPALSSPPGGRIALLLKLGAGVNPEFTGRARS